MSSLRSSAGSERKDGLSNASSQRTALSDKGKPERVSGQPASLSPVCLFQKELRVDMLVKSYFKWAQIASYSKESLVSQVCLLYDLDFLRAGLVLTVPWVFNTHVAHVTMVMLLSLHGLILKLSYFIVGFFLPFLQWMMLPDEPLSGPNGQPFGDCM